MKKILIHPNSFYIDLNIDSEADMTKEENLNLMNDAIHNHIKDIHENKLDIHYEYEELDEAEYL